MATTGTTSFNPGLGELTLHAFHLAGVRPTALTQEHMVSARMAANLIGSSWSNLPNLWRVDLQTITLVAGQATYPVPSNTILILDAYAENSNNGQQLDRVILPISRSEYSTYTNKNQEGTITTYWFDRLLSPNVTFYLVPDGQTDTTVKYYRLMQMEDAETVGNASVDVPYAFLDAFAYALAHRMAEIWMPERAAGLEMRAEKTYKIAADTNIETAGVYIAPGLSQYWRV